MPQLQSKQDLANYGLRALGAPVLDIAIDDTQIDDAIEDALQFYGEFAGDGYVRRRVLHQVTGNVLGISTVVDNFISGEVITNQAHVTATIFFPNSNTEMVIGNPNAGDLINGQIVAPVFNVGDTIVGSTSGCTATVTSYVLGDIGNRYVTLDESIQSVIDIYPLNTTSTSINNIFSISFQLRLSDLYALQTAALQQYEQIQLSLETINMLLVGNWPYEFNRRTNQLQITADWGNDIQIGNYLCFEVYQWADPDTYTQIYNARELKKLLVSYMKKRWATNLKLFSDVKIVGGVSINGKELYAEAVNEVKEAEEHIRDTYELPAQFMVG